jgi:DNA-binding ferritin-like protein (Dps family)
LADGNSLGDLVGRDGTNVGLKDGAELGDLVGGDVVGVCDGLIEGDMVVKIYGHKVTADVSR